MTDDDLDTEPARALTRVRRELAGLRWAYYGRYGETVFDVDAEMDPQGRCRLVGQVLLPAQRQAALAAASRVLPCPPYARIRVLTDAGAGGDWSVPRSEVLDVCDAPAGERATQVLRGEDPPVRRLLARRYWWVVELADGTLGWVHVDELVDLPPAEAPLDVATWRRAFAGQPRDVTPEQWRQAAAEWLGVPYLLGGTTKAGVDCSGLTQRLYRAAVGIGLPKHSLDQGRTGTRVPGGRLAAGDLLLLTHSATGVVHVAVVLDGQPPVAVHASREEGRVVTEPLSTLRARYDLRAARRLSPGGRS